MSSATDICNLALGMLGAERIADFENAQTANEQLCQLFYPIVRDMMLERKDWSFLLKRITLSTPDAETPNWGFGFSFTMPSDVYRVIRCRRDTFDGQPTSFDWRKEENKILCDQDTVFIKYISRDIPTTGYTGLFVLAFAKHLAANMCMQITENRTLKSDLLIEAEGMTMEAAALDGMQGRHEQTHASQLINARRGGGVPPDGGF